MRTRYFGEQGDELKAAIEAMQAFSLAYVGSAAALAPIVGTPAFSDAIANFASQTAAVFEGLYRDWFEIYDQVSNGNGSFTESQLADKAVALIQGSQMLMGALTERTAILAALSDVRYWKKQHFPFFKT